MRPDLELLQGAIDIHAHSHPDLFDRQYDHAEVARLARDYGFRALVIKAHHLGTVGRATFVRQLVEGIDVFDSLVLNRCVGGVNPFAVDAGIKLGVKKVFMPTVDAYGHQVMRGGSGEYDSPALKVAGGVSHLYRGLKGIYILDQEGKLLPEVREVLDLVARANVMFSAGHLTLPEITALVKEAVRMGVKKLLLDHPLSKTMQFTLEQQLELADLGCFLNHPYAQLSPRFHMVSPGDLANMIRKLGPRRVVMSSDSGQTCNPPMPECMRNYVQLMLEEGLSPEDIRLMLHENPGWMLYE